MLFIPKVKHFVEKFMQIVPLYGGVVQSTGVVSPLWGGDKKNTAGGGGNYLD